jgi:hypothetical protein
MASLLSGAITPWTGPTVAGTDVVPERWQWTSFDLTRSQTYSGVVREMKWEFPLATAKIEVQGKTWDVVLAPPVRMDFRGLVQEDIQPGTAITFQAVPSRRNPNELRAETVTIGKTTTELR